MTGRVVPCGWLEAGDETLVKSEGEFALAGILEEQVADVSSVYSEFFDILQIEKREENWCRISGKRKTTI